VWALLTPPRRDAEKAAKDDARNDALRKNVSSQQRKWVNLDGGDKDVAHAVRFPGDSGGDKISPFSLG
jgi:hypothetical protein